MNEYQHISTRQLVFITATSRIITVTVFLPVLTTGDAGRDAWIAALVATGMAVAYSLLVHLVAKDFRSESIAEFATRVVGKWPGTAAVAAFIAFYAFVVWIRIKLFFLLISVTALPKTPVWAMSALTMSIATFVAWRGLAAIGRSSEVAITLLVGSLVMILGLTTLSEIEPRWLLPVLEHGWSPVLGATVVPFYWFSVASLYALVFQPHLARPKGTGLALIIANVVSGLTLAAVAAGVVSAFGPAEATGMTSPLYSLIKNIQLGRAVRRLEIMAMVLWIVPITLDTGVAVWCVARLLAGITGLQIRHAALVTAAVMFGPAILDIPGPLEIRSLLRPQLLGPLALAVPVGLTTILWLAGKLRRGLGGGASRR